MNINAPFERFRSAFGGSRNPAEDSTADGGGPELHRPVAPSVPEDGRDGRFHTLANSLPQLVFYIDAQQICRAHNVAVERLLGLSSDRIDARPLREIVGSASYECIRSWVERALGGEEVYLRQVHRAVDGSILAFDARYVPHTGPDKAVLGFCALLTSPAVQDDAAGTPGAEQAELGGPEARALQAGAAGPDASPDIAAREQARVRIATALQSNRFCLYQQAIVPIGSAGDLPRSCEVLIRMRNEDQRLIHPGAFLGAAQQAGCMRELDRWVVDRLLRWLSAEAAAGRRRAGLFHVNLSWDSLRDESFPQHLRQMLTSHDVATDALCFEIGETDLVDHRMEVMICAQALRMLGCRVALDRFKGDSGSFSALLDLPIDFVKVDSSIVAGVRTDAQCQTKVRIIAKIAQIGGVRTVAEQVENADAVELLRRIGVDYVQGYGVAMPEPLDQITADAGGGEGVPPPPRVEEQPA